MIKTEQIIEAMAPALEKGLIVLIIIVIFKISINLFFKKLKNKKSIKNSYKKELKQTINKLTDENKRLKKELNK